MLFNAILSTDFEYMIVWPLKIVTDIFLGPSMSKIEFFERQV
jgi:hypothetical protein